MKGRLVVVSNRLPLGDNPSGGLVVALSDALERSGGLWIGTGRDIAEAPRTELEAHTGLGFGRLSFDLTEEEHRTYYAGYSNSVLWPLFHGRADLLALRSEDLEGYRAVNRRMAQFVAATVARDDLIWVQDYHLLPLAQELRSLGITNRIGFFLHIPFPNLSDIMALPNAAEFTGWLAQYDLVGLQARRDVARLLEAFRAREDAEVEEERDGAGVVRFGPNRVLGESFPIGIDTEGFRRMAADSTAARVRLEEGEQLAIGVDRLDYSKGIPQRFQAFERLLETREDLAGRISLLQIAPPTRQDVAAYRDVRDETEGLAGRINGRFADVDWTPIRFIHRAVPRERIAQLFRQSAVGLVTPLADGMNLVAKEFVAAQDEADPGVLILSTFAGAAEQMEAALLVNPYDIDQTAAAIAEALAMDRDARRARHAALMEGLRAQDIAWWSRTFLERLVSVPRWQMDTAPGA
jgi:trehalose 6-phosphate synthase